MGLELDVVADPVRIDLDDVVARRHAPGEAIDHVLARASGEGEGGGARAFVGEHVVALAAGQGRARGAADQQIGAVVAGSDDPRRQQDQVLDVGWQRVGQEAVDRVHPPAGRLGHGRAVVADIVGVIAGPALKRDSAGDVAQLVRRGRSGQQLARGPGQPSHGRRAQLRIGRVGKLIR